MKLAASQVHASSSERPPILEQSSPCSVVKNLDTDAIENFEEQIDNSSLGSPDSPSCLTDDEHSLSPVKRSLEPSPRCQEDTDLFGIDMAIHSYDEVEKRVEQNKFKLSGKQLVENLLECNRTLADKVVFYQRKCERAEAEVYDEQFECSKKLHRVRQFYRNMLYSDSRSAVMLRMATRSKM